MSDTENETKITEEVCDTETSRTEDHPTNVVCDIEDQPTTRAPTSVSDEKVDEPAKVTPSRLNPSGERDTSNVELIAFKAIVTFINDLASEYRSKHTPLKLYQRLINKTQITHNDAIAKHLNAFRKFCVVNRTEIIQKDKKLKSTQIKFSQRVYVDMEIIFKLSDNETLPVIWNHILLLSALLDPAGKAKDVLRANVEAGTAPANESAFLTDIISKVESNVDPNANPMEAVSSLMQSGVLTDLMSSMQGGMGNGELDMSKLMGAVQGMVSSLGDQVDPDAANAMGMLSGMTSMMGGAGNGNGAAPDMGAMMQMMTGLMGQMSGAGAQGPSVEDVSENKE